MTRNNKSGGPPGGDGTITLIGLVGYSAACTTPRLVIVQNKIKPSLIKEDGIRKNDFMKVFSLIDD
jgi:hypothetical protein